MTFDLINAFIWIHFYIAVYLHWSENVFFRLRFSLRVISYESQSLTTYQRKQITSIAWHLHTYTKCTKTNEIPYQENKERKKLRVFPTNINRHIKRMWPIYIFSITHQTSHIPNIEKTFIISVFVVRWLVDRWSLPHFT